MTQYPYFVFKILSVSSCSLSLGAPYGAGKYTYVANWFSFHLTCAI